MPHEPRTIFLEDGAAVSYPECRVVVLPVPYERTVSYGTGTAGGPQAILDASEQLELYDEQLACEPHRCGVWTAPPLDAGALSGAEFARLVEERVGGLLDDGKWVIALGGEHSLTVGAVHAAAARHAGLHVVQLDAHADLRDSYLGDRYSHACTMARCLERAPVRAIGVRSYSRAEAERIHAGIPGYRITHAWETDSPDWTEVVVEGLQDRPVYLTIDVDVFDPAVMPATGTPEPGGVGWQAALALLERLFGVARVVGCDVVELAPVAGLHHPAFTAARLVYKLIGFACGGGAAR